MDKSPGIESHGREGTWYSHQDKIPKDKVSWDKDPGIKAHGIKATR